jgi:hypothetical protein
MHAGARPRGRRANSWLAVGGDRHRRDAARREQLIVVDHGAQPRCPRRHERADLGGLWRSAVGRTTNDGR